MFQELANFLVVHRGDEVRDAQPRFLCRHPHGQLVAKVARGGLAHARNAQMFPQRGGDLQIEII